MGDGKRMRPHWIGLPDQLFVLSAALYLIEKVNLQSAEINGNILKSILEGTLTRFQTILV